jgi:uncharacterized phage infection (PIP) family protein YhgE
LSIFIPSAALVKQTANGSLLCLGTEDWFKLQAHIQAVQALPYDFGEYTARYGDASSGVPMQQAFDATRILKSVADRYGSPRDLRKKVLADPNLLAAALRPTGNAYLSTAWTLSRAHEDAAALASALTNIPQLAKNESASDVVDGIKSLFRDTDQILPRLTRTEKELNALIQELQEIEGKLAEAQERMQTYTSSSSQTMAALNAEIGELEQTIKDLEKSRDEAWRKWLDLTIAAIAVPAAIGIIGVGIMVLLAVPTGGGSFAVGSAVTTAAAGVAAAGLGVAASNARSKYEKLLSQIEEKSEYKQKRVLYRSDLGALNTQMQFGLPASTGAIGQLQVIADAWRNLGEEIRFKVSELNTDNLKPWLDQSQMSQAAESWRKVDQAIKAFTINSFIDATLLPPGSPLPADDPNWQASLQGQLAA